MRKSQLHSFIWEYAIGREFAFKRIELPIASAIVHKIQRKHNQVLINLARWLMPTVIQPLKKI